jgi:hypothetical protein
VKAISTSPKPPPEGDIRHFPPLEGNGANLDINNTFVAIKIKSYEVEQIIGD